MCPNGQRTSPFPDTELPFLFFTQIFAAQANSTYGNVSGTSIAAPFVSGVAGLMLSANSSLTATQLKNIIVSTADDTGHVDPAGKPVRLLNAFNAVQQALAPQITPTVLSIAIDPQSTSTVYAGAVVNTSTLTTGGGAFKSITGGQSWTPINSGLTAAPPLLIVRALAVDPTNSANVYAGTNEGAFKTTNGGQNWTDLHAGIFPFALAIDPTNTSTIYAGGLAFGGGGGVSKSVDGGQTWFALAANFQNIVFALAIDRTSPSTVYAGSYCGGILKSTNGGASWTAMNNRLTSTCMFALAISPANSSVLYATSGGTFKSTDGGQNWSLVGPSGSTIVIDQVSPNTLYVGLNIGIAKSIDGGQTFALVNTGLPINPFVNALAIDPSNPAIIYAGTVAGVYKSTNGGQNWTAANDGLTVPAP
jgi:photosystem II stability/assembly factor-like uncharacterized protein